MLTEMTDTEWQIVVEAFRAARSRRGGRGRDDRKFLETLGVGARMRVSRQYWSRPVRGVRGREWKPALQPGSCD
jgi:hypothetical protein